MTNVADGIDIGSLFDVYVLIVIALKRAILFRIRNMLRLYRFACLYLFVPFAELLQQI